jgi:hypothetical protein
MTPAIPSPVPVKHLPYAVGSMNRWYAPDYGRGRNATLAPAAGVSINRLARATGSAEAPSALAIEGVETSRRIDAMGRHDGQRPSAVGGEIKVQFSAGCSVERP